VLQDWIGILQKRWNETKVGETVPVPEDKGLGLEVAVVVDVLVAMLEVAGFELEVTVVVDVMPEGGRPQVEGGAAHMLVT